MNFKIKKILLLLLLQLSMPAGSVLADIGPKPSMEFDFEHELSGEQVTILSGVLYECNDPACSDAAPLEEVGPQGLYCQADGCQATAYGFAPYHRLEIEFSDGLTRQSNIFDTAGFESKYTVTVRPEDLLVESQLSLDMLPSNVILLLLCGCLLAGGVVLAALAIFVIRRSARV